MGACYRPPLTLLHYERLWEILRIFIDNFKFHNADFCIITGDFNDRCISWYDSHRTSELGIDLYNVSYTNNLTCC